MGIIGIIGTIIVGFVVGLIARAIMPGADKLGFLLTAALGIGGSVVDSSAASSGNRRTASSIPPDGSSLSSGR